MALQPKSCFQIIMEHIFNTLQYDLTECFRTASTSPSCAACLRDIESCMLSSHSKANKNGQCTVQQVPMEVDSESSANPLSEDDTHNISNDSTLPLQSTMNSEFGSETSIGIPSEIEAVPAEIQAMLAEATNVPAANESSISRCPIDKEKLAEVLRNISQTEPAEQTTNDLNSIEQLAQQIWSKLNEKIQSSCPALPEWQQLHSWEKLPFYWAAITRKIVSENPFENFLSTFSLSEQTESKQEIVRLWRGMHRKFKMPFVMEAFVASIAAGKLNLNNEREIQSYMRTINKKLKKVDV